MISNVYQGTFVKKLIKALNDLLVPVLYVPAALCLLLSLLTPKAGSGARERDLLIAGICIAVILVVKLFDRYFKRSDAQYYLNELKISKKLELTNLVPLLVLTVIVLVPFYLLFVTSIKNEFEAMRFDFSWWPEEGVDLGSYKYLLELQDRMDLSIVRSFINSFVYALIPTIVGLFSSALAAYAFSKLQFRMKGAMYGFLIMTMMLPGCITMSTNYLLFELYGWTHSPLPLIIPGFFGGAGSVMFLREFMMGIPNGLLEAAEIDGAGRWRRFFSIMLPLAKPALTAQFILGFISGFNSYLGPLIYLDESSDYTVQIFVNWMNGDIQIAALQATMAAACICALVPMLILYILFQKTILNGISISSGLKG